MTPGITEADVRTALRSFLMGVLPAGTEIIRAQVNRVASPKKAFVEMTVLRRERLSFNVDEFTDTALVGAIVGTTLTVSSVGFGSIRIGAPVYGAADGTYVTGMVSGDGGAGTYTVSPAQTLASSPLFAGVGLYLQPTRLIYQLDVYGAGSGDHAQVISTLFRDEYATQRFPTSIQPLDCSDPRQMPFITGEAQYEDRWIVEASLQANITIQAPQQFADQLEPILIPVP